MLKLFLKNWWLLGIKGILLIIFALFAFFNPGASAATLAMWFALLIIIDGLVTTLTFVGNWKEREDKWLFLAEGLISMIFGVILFMTPGITLVIVSLFIGFWFVFAGVSRIAKAIQLRKEIEGESWVIIGGAISVIFGLLVFARPLLGISSLMYIIGFFALLIGFLLIAVSLKLRKVKNFIKIKGEKLKSAISEEQDSIEKTKLKN